MPPGERIESNIEPNKDTRNIPESEEGASLRQSIEDTGAISKILNRDNRSFFDRISEGGREIFTRFYRKIYETPVANRIVGKLEIAYDNFWINLHQNEALKLQGERTKLEARISAIEESRRELEALVKDFTSFNLPGAEKLNVKMQELEKQKANLMTRRDEILSDLETTQRRIDLYTERRNLIADRLIGYYQERLKPIEAELRNLQNLRGECDLLIEATDIRHRQMEDSLFRMEERRIKLEEALRNAGFSEKSIKEATKDIMETIDRTRERLRREREALEERRARINERIMKAEDRANRYKDKQEEFARIRGIEPLRIDIPKRREEFIESLRNKYESELEQEPFPTIEEYIKAWNALYSKQEFLKIDFRDFSRKTLWRNSFRVNWQEFSRILLRYLTLSGLDYQIVSQSIDRFYNYLTSKKEAEKESPVESKKLQKETDKKEADKEKRSGKKQQNRKRRK
jgi:DNA repair exonuclease SbcCD ATPase subunit